MTRFSVAKMYEIASSMYILPPYRFTVYAFGIILGYYLRVHKDLKIERRYLKLGWNTLTFIFIATVILCSRMTTYDYEYNALHAAIFASVGPLVWCTFCAWIIFTAQLGYRRGKMKIFKSTLKLTTKIKLNFQGKLVRMLEWRGFQITTKLSYGIYLVQFAVFHYNISTTRGSSHVGMVTTVVSINETETFFSWLFFFAHIFSHRTNLITD